MLVSISKWLHSRTSRKTNQKSPLNKGHRCLNLEFLEERTVPSTWLVTSSADSASQAGTLRYDIGHASNGDTIVLSSKLQSTGIVLTQGELLINKNLTIVSQGGSDIEISGNNTSRVLEVAAGHTLNLKDVKIANGTGPANQDNSGHGGGVLNFGTLNVTGSTFSSNFGVEGGGIDNFGTVNVSGSTFSNNTGANGGGGIDNEGGATANINNSILMATARSMVPAFKVRAP